MGGPGGGATGGGGGGADAGTGGASGARGDAGTTPDMGGPGGSGGEGGPTTNSKFSFFVVSLKALQMLSGKTEGFGGNLTFGQQSGLAGADEICRRAAEMGLPGAGKKQWRAFLSATTGGPNNGPVHARDRIGPGPWYDRNEKLVSLTVADLFVSSRPKGDPTIINDLTNERGEPNHHVGPNGYVATAVFDDHDTLTGSDVQGRLRATSPADTCNNWTSTTGGRPYIGHSWPRSSGSGLQWASDHTAPGCTPGLDRTLGGSGSGGCVGCAGGYGGFYCFALP
jgi:hypothetical protein